MKICLHMEELLNRPLHEFLSLTPVMILIILFCSVNIFLLLDELPQTTIQYFIIEQK
jgi:hypothetical protein